MIETAFGIIVGVLISGCLQKAFPGTDLTVLQALVIAASCAIAVVIGVRPRKSTGDKRR